MGRQRRRRRGRRKKACARVREYSTFKHFRMRLFERYRLDITIEEWRDLARAVHLLSGASMRPREFIDKQSGTRSHWRIPFRDAQIRVVYSSSQAYLLTALPKEAG